MSVKYWSKNGETFKIYEQFGSGHAIFCSSLYDQETEQFFINCDVGYSEIRGPLGEIYFSQELRKNLQDGVFFKDNRYFIGVDYFGNIYLWSIDIIDEALRFTLIEQYNVGKGFGMCVYFSTNTKQILIGTTQNIILFNPDDFTIKFAKIPTIKVFSIGNLDYLLSHDRIYKFDEIIFDSSIQLIKYKYQSISIIGSHSSGKTEFCKWITEQKSEINGSSFGRKIWKYNVNDKKRVYISDYAGQKDELLTYLPEIKNSDAIYIFYQKPELDSFKDAVEIYKKISENFKGHINFVENFIDHDREVGKRYKIDQLEKIGIVINKNLYKISVLKKINLESVKNSIENLNCTYAKSIKKTKIYEDIEDCIESAYNKNLDALELDYFSNLNIKKKDLINILKSSYHDRFLYFEEQKGQIILNDVDFAKLQSCIPINFSTKQGLINFNDLINICKIDFPEIQDDKIKNYCEIILKDYLNKNIVYLNNQKYIMFHFLEEKIKTPKFDNVNYFKLILAEENIIANVEYLFSLFITEDFHILEIAKKGFILQNIDQTEFIDIRAFENNKEALFEICIFNNDKLKENMINFFLQDKSQFKIVNFLPCINSETNIDDITFLKKILKTPRETSYFDMKSILLLDDKKQKAEFLKDVIALLNSSFSNSNIGYLLVGIQEEQSSFEKTISLDDLRKLEEKIKNLFETYIFNIIQFDRKEISIKKLKGWIETGEISQNVLVEGIFNDFGSIILFKFNRIKGSVYEIGKEINWNENKKIKTHHVGDSWIRIGSHTIRMREFQRNYLRNN